MATPVGDSYTCASGGAIAAGRSLAPSIAGSVWTPARDASGSVTVGNWLGLPLNTWLDVSGQAVNNVVETPHLLNNWGSDSATSIAAVWCGAGWDYVNQRMYIMGGGVWTTLPNITVASTAPSSPAVNDLWIEIP